MLPISKESTKSPYAPITQKLARILSRLSNACWTVYVELRQKSPAGYPVKAKAAAIAAEYGFSLRTIRRALKELENVGLLTPETNGYRIVKDPDYGVTAPKGNLCTLSPQLPSQGDKNVTDRVTKMADKGDKNVTNKATNDKAQIQAVRALSLTTPATDKEDITENTYRETQQPSQEGVTAPKGENCTLSPLSQAEPTAVVVSLKNVDPGKKRMIINRLIDSGVSDIVAYQLAKSYQLERIEDQLRWLPLRPPAENKAGLLVKAIKENYSAPPAAIAEATAAVKEVEKVRCDLAAPPPGARWAVRVGGGDRYRIEEIGLDFVRTDRFIIMRAQWPNWAWMLDD